MYKWCLESQITVYILKTKSDIQKSLVMHSEKCFFTF